MELPDVNFIEKKLGKINMDAVKIPYAQAIELGKLELPIPRFEKQEKKYFGMIMRDSEVYLGKSNKFNIPLIRLKSVKTSSSFLNIQLGKQKEELFELRYGAEKGRKLVDVKTVDPHSKSDKSIEELDVFIDVIFNRQYIDDITYSLLEEDSATVYLEFEFNIGGGVFTDNFITPVHVKRETISPKIEWFGRDDQIKTYSGDVYDLGHITLTGTSETKYTTPYAGDLVVEGFSDSLLNALSIDTINGLLKFEKKKPLVLPISTLKKGNKAEFSFHIDINKYQEAAEEKILDLKFSVAKEEIKTSAKLPELRLPTSFIDVLLRFENNEQREFYYQKGESQHIANLTILHRGDESVPFDGVIDIRKLIPDFGTRKYSQEDLQNIIELKTKSPYIRIENNQVLVEGLLDGKTAEVKVFLDYSRFSIGDFDQSLNMSLHVIYPDGKDLTTIRESFKVANPPANNKLYFEPRRAEADKLGLSGFYEGYTLKNRVAWTKDSRNNRPSVFTVLFGNQSKRDGGNGAVIIKNLRVEAKSEVNFDLKNSSQVNTPFSYNITYDKQNLDLSERTYVFREGEKHARLQACVESEKILEMSEDEALVDFVVSFDYIETDNFGEIYVPEEKLLQVYLEEDYQRREITIAAEVYRDLGTEWIAFDFGTSAMVMAHAKGGIDAEFNVVNFNKALSKYNSSRQKVIETEEGTNFLTSRLLLAGNGSGTMLHDDYNKSLVKVSVPLQRYIINRNNGIPNLKSLIGLQNISSIRPALKGYTFTDDKGMVRGEEEPLQVAEIMKDTYHNVLRHFFLSTDAVKNNDAGINKIILTVPNSFTLMHEKLIRDLILDTPDLRDRFKQQRIKFISESDAVMYYYLSNRRVLNEARSEEARNYFMKSESVEHILIYDMGAGTLDLTYLIRERTIDKETKLKSDTVDILARFGVNTAGNYLDFVLAKIVFDIYGKKGEGKFGNFTENPFANNDFNKSNEYKLWIRNVLKPRLSRVEANRKTINLSELIEVKKKSNSIFRNNFTVDPMLVIRHEEFEKYLQDNSDNLMRKMFELIGKNVEDVQVDTVIFSGRGSQLQILRDRVISTLRKSPLNADVYACGLEQAEKTEKQLLKSVVVKGALDYAKFYYRSELLGRGVATVTDDRLKARYGILVGNIYTDEDSWQFHEILAAGTKANKEGYQGSKTINLHNASHFLFVQSFLPARYDNDESYFPPGRKQNFDGNYITVIQEFDRNDNLFAIHDWLRFDLKIDKKERLSFQIYDIEDDVADLIDETKIKDALRINSRENEIFQKSEWPYYTFDLKKL